MNSMEENYAYHDNRKVRIGDEIYNRSNKTKQNPLLIVGIDEVHQPLIECKYCSRHTAMLGTQLCHGCWEAKKAIYLTPEQLAKLIICEAEGEEYVRKLTELLMRETGYVEL